MSVGHQAGYEALAKQTRAQQKNMEDRLARRRDQTQGRAESAMDLPQEQMACPKCKQKFAFGSECPDCEVLLVTESAADTVPELARPKKKIGRSLLYGAVVVALTICFVLMLFVLVFDVMA